MSPLGVTAPRRVIAAITCCLFAVVSMPAVAADCLDALQPLLEDTSDDCVGIPSNPKFFEASTFRWGGTERLIVNTGNELKLWSVQKPRSPVFGAASAFNVPNQGDSDYDLLNFSVCDGCRYGVAVFKLGISLFDFGTLSAPGFTDDFAYMTSSEPQGAFTFSIGGQQYLEPSHPPALSPDLRTIPTESTGPFRNSQFAIRNSQFAINQILNLMSAAFSSNRSDDCFIVIHATSGRRSFV